MGWRASTLIIHNPEKVDNELLIKELGYNGLTKIEDEPFEIAISPDENKIYIGSYNNNLLICGQDISMRFLTENDSKTEKVLNQYFPDAEICSIALQSTTNFWGYSIIKNGQRIRTRLGSADFGTFEDFGEPLEEEKELLSKSKIDDKGNRIYFFDDFPNEPFSEDQVGENLVFAICKRYFGKELDRADDLLFDTILIGYSFQSDAISDTEIAEPKIKKESKWQTFFLILLACIVWQILKRTLLKN